MKSGSVHLNVVRECFKDAKNESKTFMPHFMKVILMQPTQNIYGPP